MKLKNYYKILGVDRSASSKEIKEAFQNLAKKFHPDIKPNDAESLDKFKEVLEAYKILGNLDYRLHYSFILDQKKTKIPTLVRKFNLPIDLND